MKTVSEKLEGLMDAVARELFTHSGDAGAWDTHMKRAYAANPDLESLAIVGKYRRMARFAEKARSKWMEKSQRLFPDEQDAISKALSDLVAKPH